MPYSTKEKANAYMREHYTKNCEEKKAWQREYRKRNKEVIKKREQQKRIREPWRRAYDSVMSRCSYAGSYGKKGIKNHLKLKDFKYLWFRDKAYEMKRPYIDRIDSNGDYILENCRYMEHEENMRRGHKGISHPHQKEEVRMTDITVYLQDGRTRTYQGPNIISID